MLGGKKLANQWDDLMKMLVREDPQALVSLLLPGASFQGVMDKELKTRTIEADLLYRIIWNRKKVVLHVEFQRRRDKNMGRRLWEYNSVTSYLSRLPVRSIVLYLVKGGKVIEPPYHELTPDGELNHVFYYKNIKLWELSAETLKQSGFATALPLLPLTHNGKRREIVEDMIRELKAVGRADLLPLGYAFAALTFVEEVDKTRLKERFWSMADVLEGSWAYQEMVEKGMTQGLEKGMKQGLEKGLEKGMKQGLEKGMKQGLEQGLRLTLNRIVEMHFPDLAPLAKRQTKHISDPKELRAIIDALLIAQTVEEAQQALLQTGDESS